MELKGTCRILASAEQPADWNRYLYLLYYPLMGKDACILYCLLSALQGMEMDMEEIVRRSMLSAARFENARKCLEQFWLLQTWQDSLHESWQLDLQPVLNPREFLRNETYSRLFLNEMGSAAFEKLRQELLQEESHEGFTDVSERFDSTRLDQSWTASKERTYSRLRPEEKKRNRWRYDYDAVFYKMDRIFPAIRRTDDVLELIGRLGNVYGVSPEQMRKYLNRSVNAHTGAFSRETLESLVMASHEAAPVQQDLYAMAPVQFLLQKQNGAPVSEADKKLISKLAEDYDFPLDVVNLLLEYCLNSTNQRLSSAYVEKVAGTWARLGVDSREKAMEQIHPKEEPKKKSPARGKPADSQLPDWYANTQASAPDAELLARIEEQKKLLQKKGGAES